MLPNPRHMNRYPSDYFVHISNIPNTIIRTLKNPCQHLRQTACIVPRSDDDDNAHLNPFDNCCSPHEWFASHNANSSNAIFHMHNQYHHSPFRQILADILQFSIKNSPSVKQNEAEECCWLGGEHRARIWQQFSGCDPIIAGHRVKLGVCN